MVVELKIGNTIPWTGFDTPIETDKGPIEYSSWTMRDGWTIYESVEKNENQTPKFFVLADDDIVCAVVEIGESESVDSVFDKILETKKITKRP